MPRFAQPWLPSSLLGFSRHSRGLRSPFLVIRVSRAGDRCAVPGFGIFNGAKTRPRGAARMSMGFTVPNSIRGRAKRARQRPAHIRPSRKQRTIEEQSQAPTLPRSGNIARHIAAGRGPARAAKRRAPWRRAAETHFQCGQRAAGETQAGRGPAPTVFRRPCPAASQSAKKRQRASIAAKPSATTSPRCGRTFPLDALLVDPTAAFKRAANEERRKQGKLR